MTRRARPPWVLALASTSAITTGCVLPPFLLAAMAVQIRRDLGFGEAGTGLAMAAFFLVASALSAPLGRVAERVGPERALRVAGVGSALAALALAAGARSLGALCGALAVAGGANALCQPAANLLLARVLPRARQGIGFAVKQSAVPASSMLAGLVVPAVALTIGWRWGFVLGSGFALAAVASLRSRAGVAAAPTRPDADPGDDPPAAVMATLTVAIGLGAAAAGSLGAFLVSAAVDAGMTEGGAGLLLSGGSVAGIGVRLAAGARADRRAGGHLRVVTAMLAAGALCFAALATGSVPVFLVAAPAAFATGWAWPGLFNLAIVRANPRAPGAATGVTQTGTYVGAVVGPVLFGLVAGTVSYALAWLAAGALALAAAVLMWAGRARLRAWRDGTRRAPVGRADAGSEPIPPLPA